MYDDFVDVFGVEWAETLFCVFAGDCDHEYISVSDKGTDATGANGFFQESGTMLFFGMTVEVISGNGNGNGDEIPYFDEEDIEETLVKVRNYEREMDPIDRNVQFEFKQEKKIVLP